MIMVERSLENNKLYSDSAIKYPAGNLILIVGSALLILMMHHTMRTDG